MKAEQQRINETIRAHELRVIDDEGNNLGVISLSEALKIASDRGQDLIEVSPDAKPPVAKIADYGKFQYDQKKKLKEIKAKTVTSEVKNIQVKIGTGEGDMGLKAKKASEWMEEGHRVKIELFLRGRSKGMDKNFLRDRLHRVLALLTTPYRLVEDAKDSPKGIAILVERAKK